MAETLILDSEALNAIARESERGVLGERARAILRVAHETRSLVRVPAPVLAEVCRGGRFDAAIEHLLHGRGIEVLPLTERIAKRAGALLAKAKLGSAHTIDAFVVASAIELSPSIIATGDRKDIAHLMAGHKSISIIGL